MWYNAHNNMIYKHIWSCNHIIDLRWSWHQIWYHLLPFQCLPELSSQFLWKCGLFVSFWTFHNYSLVSHSLQFCLIIIIHIFPWVHATDCVSNCQLLNIIATFISFHQVIFFLALSHIDISVNSDVVLLSAVMYVFTVQNNHIFICKVPMPVLTGVC